MAGRKRRTFSAIGISSGMNLMQGKWLPVSNRIRRAYADMPMIGRKMYDWAPAGKKLPKCKTNRSIRLHPDQERCHIKLSAAALPILSSTLSFIFQTPLYEQSTV
jgi:hypothetical protein